MRSVRLSGAMLVLALGACICSSPSSSGPRVVDTEGPSGDPLTEENPTPVPPPAFPTAEPGTRPTELAPEQIDYIAQASVQIIAARGSGSSIEPMWTGSGTLISPSGEILTNCHVACGAPLLLILMTTTPDQPPQERYLAEITHFDEELDLALLQITTDIDGNPTTPSGLPYLEQGDSNSLRLGDPIRIFGYPGVGGATITLTSGSVSGFETAGEERVVIKTDAEISGGNSGGTAVDLFGRLVGVPTWVNTDVREGVTIGGIGVLRPVNLVEVVRGQAGAPPAADSAELPPMSEPDTNEPNDNYETATGPITSGSPITAYISWQDDLDVYYFDIINNQPIVADLSIPSGNDYDLYLFNESGEVVAKSESETPSEYIEYLPASSGRYWVVVNSYEGISTTEPYRLSVTFDGGGGAGAITDGIAVTGITIDAATGRPIDGATFGILAPGISCETFFGALSLDFGQVIASGETNAKGAFTLNGIPRGAVYSAFILLGNNYVCENNWLDVPGDAIDTNLGTIDITF